MPAPYNLSVFNNTQVTFLTYFNFANDASEGFFGIFFLLSLFVIFFVSMKTFSNRQALATSSIITFFVAIGGRLMGVMPDIALVFSFVLLGGAMVMLYVVET